MIIGIDLGTTFTAAAYLNHNQIPTICPDQITSIMQTPSVVHIGEKGCLVGEIVEQLFAEEPELSVARFVKLAMGKDIGVHVDHQGNNYSPEAISALILKKIKRDAEFATGEPITGAVITVPEHFDEKQRLATENAGRLADLNVLAIVEEPVAAAVYFGLNNTQDKTVFVFDMGGGTFDASIVQSTPDGVYVLAAEGASNIGGKNLDEEIIKIAAELYQKTTANELQGDEHWNKLRRYATKMKLTLSNEQSVEQPMQLAGTMLNLLLSRSQFESAISPWLEACQHVCEQALAAQMLEWNDIDEIHLTGGSTLTPCVRELITNLSGLPSDKIKHHEPHLAVAFGAALLAEQYSANNKNTAPPLRQTVTSNELGIKILEQATGRSKFHPLIEKNLPVPIEASTTVFTQQAQQEYVMLDVLQRKDKFSHEESIGQFRFGPLPASQKEQAVEITMGYDSTGRVSIKANSPASGKTLEQAITQNGNLNLSATYQQLSTLDIKS